jgi:hypothetical protein
VNCGLAENGNDPLAFNPQFAIRNPQY